MTSSEEKSDIKTASYKFNTNLLKLSVSDDIEEAKTEWEFITSLTKEDTNNLCICQHKVKHINYFLNRQNQNTIICGSKCCKKFKFEAQEMKSKRLSQLLINNLRKGEYEQIDNILMYNEKVKHQLIRIFQNEYEINKNDINKLKKLFEEIEELIDYYKFECLIDLKNSILETINEIETPKLKMRIIAEYYQRKYDLYIKTNDINKLKELLEEIEDRITKNKDTKHIIITNIECLYPLKNDVETKIKELENKTHSTDRDNIRAHQEKNKQVKYIYYEQERMNHIKIQREEIEKQQQKEKVIEIKENKIANNINYWFCRFCSLSRIEQHGLFFNDMLCVQCAKSNGYY